MGPARTAFAALLALASVAALAGVGVDQSWQEESGGYFWSGWDNALIALGLVLGINVAGVFIGHRFGMPALVGIIVLGIAALKFFGG